MPPSGSGLAGILEALATSGVHAVASLAGRYAEEALRAPPLAVAAAVDLVAVGIAMLADDIMDLGRTDRIHHWMIGLILLAAGLAVLAVILLRYRG